MHGLLHVCDVCMYVCVCSRPAGSTDVDRDLPMDRSRLKVRGDVRDTLSLYTKHTFLLSI